MVQRTPILLSVLVLLGGLSCAPETLKIHLPPKGIDSVNQEDLQRAYWALDSGTDPIEWWSNRTTQFHLQSTTSGCYVYEREGADKWTVYAQLSPMQLTVMASMAKALDGIETSRTWVFCASDSPPYNVGNQVINLKDDWSESPSFIDVNFVQLALDVQKSIREYKLFE